MENENEALRMNQRISVEQFNCGPRGTFLCRRLYLFKDSLLCRNTQFTFISSKWFDLTFEHTLYLWLLSSQLVFLKKEKKKVYCKVLRNLKKKV